MERYQVVHRKRRKTYEVIDTTTKKPVAIHADEDEANRAAAAYNAPDDVAEESS